MAFARPTRITSWSFSRYSVYKQCPFKAKLKFIDRRSEPGSPAMERGDQIHKAIDAYVKGEKRTAPPEAKAFKDIVAGLRAAYKADAVEAKKAVGGRPPHARRISIEDTWAFTATWGLTRWDDWNGCVLRIKTDAAVLEGPADVAVYDWKTGKHNERNVAEYSEQTELYALGALTLYAPLGPSLTVRPKLVYLDAGVTHPPEGSADTVYTPADVPRLKKAWAARTRPMLNDKTFAPRPNNLCRFCHFRKENGGPCQY